MSNRSFILCHDFRVWNMVIETMNSLYLYVLVCFGFGTANHFVFRLLHFFYFFLVFGWRRIFFLMHASTHRYRYRYTGTETHFVFTKILFTCSFFLWFGCTPPCFVGCRSWHFELHLEWNAYQYKIYGVWCNRNLYIGLHDFKKIMQE